MGWMQHARRAVGARGVGGRGWRREDPPAWPCLLFAVPLEMGGLLAHAGMPRGTLGYPVWPQSRAQGKLVWLSLSHQAGPLLWGDARPGGAPVAPPSTRPSLPAGPYPSTLPRTARCPASWGAGGTRGGSPTRLWFWPRGRPAWAFPSGTARPGGSTARPPALRHRGGGDTGVRPPPALCPPPLPRAPAWSCHPTCRCISGVRPPPPPPGTAPHPLGLGRTPSPPSCAQGGADAHPDPGAIHLLQRGRVLPTPRTQRTPSGSP